MGLAFRSALELRSEMAAGRVSPVEVLDAVLERIGSLDGRLRCYWTLDESGARAAAREAEQAIRRGQPLGPLHGVPFSVKDLLATSGLRTTRGSVLFEQYVPDFSAPAVERIQAAGGILVGKTSTAELGWKAVTDAPLFGATANPWDLSRTAGGSSGGAAAAVAAGLGPLALATDAAGSTRLPAAFCGVFGLKPSFGRIPVVPGPAADSLVHTGLITRSVRDCALLLSVVAGPDERDRNSLPADAALGRVDDLRPLEDARIAWCPQLPGVPVDPAVAAACLSSAKALARAGWKVDEIRLDLPPVLEAFRTLFQGSFGAPVADVLSRWRDRMDPGLVALVEAGRSLTAYDLTKAGMVRYALAEALAKLFSRYDLVLLPVAGVAAFPLGTDEPPGQPGLLAWLGYLYPFNMTGHPAASVPCGWTPAGLPVGLQLVGPRFGDTLVLRGAAMLEQIQPWADRRPSL